MADDLTLDLEHGRLTITREAVAEIVAERTLGCYGVVGLSAGTRVGRIFRREGISIDGDARALRIQVHIVVAHGLNLAEVAASIAASLGSALLRAECAALSALALRGMGRGTEAAARREEAVGAFQAFGAQAKLDHLEQEWCRA